MFSNVISKNDMRQLGKRTLLTAALLLALIVAGLFVSAVSGQRVARNFEQAADFPRGALVYAQFEDLPALLKQWKESQLKDRYLNSVSFQQMQSRHLAIKLLSRWEEFNSAAGSPIDLGAFGSLAGNRAAIAVYDIGKLDLVLIAPISETKLEACLFFQKKDNFEKIEPPDGTTYYLHDVEADRGRQKQHIAFAYVKGRFVLATSEKLLLRAVANINGEGMPDRQKDRLADEPSFQELAKTFEPHFVTVWVQQSKLNDDWYFKHYWLMSNAADLKNIRAGIFDLQMQQGRWVERREFLLNGKTAAGAALSKQALRQIERIVPADAPFVQLREVNTPGVIAELAGNALFDGKVRSRDSQSASRNWRNYSDGDFDVSPSDEGSYGESRYSYLDDKFDSAIDEVDEDAKPDDSTLRLAGERRFARTLQTALQSARPLAAARLARPKVLERALFAEFARAAVISLQTPSALDPVALERAIGELAASRLMIAGAYGKFAWKNRTAGDIQWREMELPMLGRSAGYGVRGSELIVSNNPQLLSELMTGKQSGQSRIESTSPVHELTVIRLSQRKQAFDQIFARLEEPMVKAYWQQRRGEQASGPSQEFFSGEVASLLDVASPVDEVRIERSFANGRMREEITAKLK